MVLNKLDVGFVGEYCGFIAGNAMFFGNTKIGQFKMIIATRMHMNKPRPTNEVNKLHLTLAQQLLQIIAEFAFLSLFSCCLFFHSQCAAYHVMKYDKSDCVFNFSQKKSDTTTKSKIFAAIKTVISHLYNRYTSI